jgi:hypothetical protein
MSQTKNAAARKWTTKKASYHFLRSCGREKMQRMASGARASYPVE